MLPLMFAVRFETRHEKQLVVILIWANGTHINYMCMFALHR